MAEQVRVRVPPDLADQLGAVGAQAGDDGLEVVHGEREVPDAQGVGRRLRVTAFRRRGRRLPVGPLDRQVWKVPTTAVTRAPPDLACAACCGGGR